MPESASRGGGFSIQLGGVLHPAGGGSSIQPGGVPPSSQGGVLHPAGGGGFLHPAGGVSLPDPPPVNRMTDRCKNITLAKTSFRPVINPFFYNVETKLYLYKKKKRKTKTSFGSYLTNIPTRTSYMYCRLRFVHTYRIQRRKQNR